MDSQNRAVGHARKSHNDADSICRKRIQKTQSLNRERRETSERGFNAKTQRGEAATKERGIYAARHTAIWRPWNLLKPNHIGRRSGVNAAFRKIFDKMSDLDGLQCEGAQNFNRGCAQIFSLHNFGISALALYEDCLRKMRCGLRCRPIRMAAA